MVNVQEGHSDDLKNILAKRADQWAARDAKIYQDCMDMVTCQPDVFNVLAARMPIKIFDYRNEPGYPVVGVPFQTVSPSDVLPTPHYVETLYAPPIGPPVFGGADWKPKARPPRPPNAEPSSLHLQGKVAYLSGSHSIGAPESHKRKNPAAFRRPQNSLYARRTILDIILARKRRNMKVKTKRIQKALMKSPKSKANKAKALATKSRPPRSIMGSPSFFSPMSRTVYKSNQKDAPNASRSNMSYML